LGLSKRPPKDVKSKESRLIIFIDLEKWDTSDLLHLMTRLSWLKREKNDIITTKEKHSISCNTSFTKQEDYHPQTKE